MRTRVLTLVAPLMLATIATAHAQGRRGGSGGPPGPGGRGGNPACMVGADSLTDTQKAQVKVLSDAFAKAHQPQLDSLRAIMDAARAAREAGKTPDEIRAIMELGKPINDELAPARKAFRETVVTYLTPAQIADGCIPPGPGGPPPGGRRGGPPPGPPAM